MLEIKTVNKGAELVSVIYNGIEKMHDGQNFWNRHSPILFPIVGKLKDNKTKINGNEYQKEYKEILSYKNVYYCK